MLLGGILSLIGLEARQRLEIEILETNYSGKMGFLGDPHVQSLGTPTSHVADTPAASEGFDSVRLAE